MKIVSDRPRDLEDARAIVSRRRESLDRKYLEPRVAEMAQLLERDDIVTRWRTWSEPSSS